MHRTTTHTKAFTLIETLVAIAILMVALIGPFETVESALTASYDARDELIASSLAQQAVEYVLNIRDNDYLYNKVNGTSRSWLYGLDGTNGTSCITPNKCVVDPLAQTVVACTAGNCSALPLYIGAVGSTYPYSYNQSSSGTLSKFTRSIQLCYVSGSSCGTTATNEAKLTVTVTWNTSHQAYTTTIVEYVENWL